MSEAAFLGLAVALLGAAGLGVVSASIGALMALYWRICQRRERRELAVSQDLAIALDDLRTDLMILEMEYQFTATSYRYNVHCPSCGRFARLALGTEDIAICAVHELQVLWSQIPVDWEGGPIASVSEGVIVHSESISSETAAIILPVLTGPIGIITPDTLSLEQLQEEGAVL